MNMRRSRVSADSAIDEEPVAVQPLSVDMRRLTRVGSRPNFLDYLVQLWDLRQFIFYDARARVQSGTRRDRLGSAWLLLNPVFNGLTYFLIFGLLLNTSKGIENFVGYLVVGIFMFQFSSGAITSGARSIRNNKSMVQAFNFPRAALPIGANVRELLSAVPLILAMLLIVVVLPPAEEITWLWIWCTGHPAAVTVQPGDRTHPGPDYLPGPRRHATCSPSRSGPGCTSRPSSLPMTASSHIPSPGPDQAQSLVQRDRHCPGLCSLRHGFRSGSPGPFSLSGPWGAVAWAWCISGKGRNPMDAAEQETLHRGTSLRCGGQRRGCATAWPRARLPDADADTAQTRFFRRAVSKPNMVTVHALNELSLVVERGESVGIIGRNGSGKSTLMKIISGQSKPTSGAVYASSTPIMLGVNAALVQDLSGDQNVVLGCLAMGMSRAEVDAKIQQHCGTVRTREVHSLADEVLLFRHGVTPPVCDRGERRSGDSPGG